MRCIHCAAAARPWGRDRAGHRRYRCQSCGRTFALRPPKPLGPLRLPLDQALLGLRVLLEGSSVRGAERVTGVHRDTLCRLVSTVGRGCGPLMRHLTRGFAPAAVETAEIRTFIAMKQATKVRRGLDDPRIGEVMAWLALEPRSRLVVAWGLGRCPSAVGVAAETAHAARNARSLQARLARLGTGGRGFSRKWQHLEAALALHIGHDNLCRIHVALCCTPAMAAGITERLWSLEDLVRAACAPPAVEPDRNPSPRATADRADTLTPQPPLPPNPPIHPGEGAPPPKPSSPGRGDSV